MCFLPLSLYYLLAFGLPLWTKTIYGVDKLTANPYVDQVQDKVHAQAQGKHAEAGAGHTRRTGPRTQVQGAHLGQWRKKLLRIFGPELIRIKSLIKTARSAVSKNRAERALFLQP